jgi:hypothetical protein
VGGEVHPEDGARRRRVEVGVGHDDQGVLAAEFQGHVLHAGLRGLALDEPSGVGCPDEADPADQGVSDQRLSADRATPRHDGAQIGPEHLGGELGHSERGQRRLVGSLEDDGVTGDQGSGDLPGGEEQRMVERDDPAHHPVGFLQAVVQVLRQRVGRPTQGQGVVGHDLEQGRRRIDVGPHDRQREPGIDRVEGGEFVGVCPQQSRELAHRRRARPRRERSPGALCPGGGHHDPVHVLDRAVRGIGQDAAGRRVLHLVAGRTAQRPTAQENLETAIDDGARGVGHGHG